MGAKLTSGTSVDGVIAYQDHSDPQQFHYLPARADCILKDTLVNFETTYWGVSRNPYWVDTGTDVFSSVGGILAGQARLDISQRQRDRIVAAIEAEFKVKNPRLLPLLMDKIEVQPVIAQNIIELSKSNTVTFPKQLQFGTSFNYLVSSTNSLFATLAAGTTNSPVPRPSFGLNVYGDMEFVGDPWEAEIKCDLSQVWSYTRSQVGGSVGWGWFSIGASYEKIVQDLRRNQIIKVKFIQGSGEEGRQMFEVAKQIFEKINSLAIAGEGFFKFEPNPNPQGGSGSGSSAFPWGVSINASYSSQSFTQEIKFEETLNFTGRVKVRMGSSMVLAVGCSDETKQFFHDYSEPSEPCLKQYKTQGLQDRLACEQKAKNVKAREYLRNLESGIWDEVKYRQMMAILKTISLCESLVARRNKDGERIITVLDSEQLNRALSFIEDAEARKFGDPQTEVAKAVARLFDE